MSFKTRLIVMWLACFAIASGLIVCWQWRTESRTPPLEMYTNIGAVYSPYLASMLGFIFAARSRMKEHPTPASPTPNDLRSIRERAWLAFGCSLLFNVLIILSVYLATKEKDKGIVDHAFEVISKLATVFGGLVGPAIGYYFGANIEAASTPPSDDR